MYNPDKYGKFATIEKNETVLCVQILKALYGLQVLAVPFCKKFKKDVKEISFKLNPYDMYITNRLVNGSQRTLACHMNDTKSTKCNPLVQLTTRLIYQQ